MTVYRIGVSALSLSDSAKEKGKIMGRGKAGTFVKRMDLSNPFCHVCGKPLRRNFTQAKEWCINSRCQVNHFMFNISYVHDEIEP